MTEKRPTDDRTKRREEPSGPKGPDEPSGPKGIVEIPARMACPECGKETVVLGVKASTTVWFTCTNPECSFHGEHRPPDELGA